MFKYVNNRQYGLRTRRPRDPRSRFRSAVYAIIYRNYLKNKFRAINARRASYRKGSSRRGTYRGRR